jgi:hypothetical protein
MSNDWLNRLLSGELVPEPTDLDAFVATCGDAEGLHHEFKPGADPSSGSGVEPAVVLRKYLAGFANSDGGFVLFGYSQRLRTFDGFKAPGGGRVVDWASRAIQPIAGYLSPPPRIVSIPHPAVGQAEVLIVAVQRAPALVPTILGGRPQFYFRIGDSTVEMPAYNTIGVPDYLVGDILLGRRQRPRLMPSGPTLKLQLDPIRRLGGNVHAHEALIGVSLENQSLVYAEAVTAGIVSWSLDRELIPNGPRRKSTSPVDPFADPSLFAPAHLHVPDLTRRNPTHVPRSLDGYIDEEPPEPNSRETWSNPWRTVHAPAWCGPLDLNLAPFASTNLRFGPLVLPVFDCTESELVPPADELARHHWALRRGYLRLAIALYVVAKASEPQWFGLEAVYGYESLPQAPEELSKPSRRVTLELSPYARVRARVAVAVEKTAIAWGT